MNYLAEWQLSFTHRGGVYTRSQISAICAVGGDKPRPYIYRQASTVVTCHKIQHLILKSDNQPLKHCQ